MTWPELVTAALLGTARREPPPAPPALLDGEPAATPEGELLRQAAALAIYRRAGERPRRLAVPDDRAPAETLPAAPPAAGEHLARIIDGPRALLPEWLRALADSGRRARPEDLPWLLRLGANDRDLAPLIEPVLGERGRWLARARAEWEWARAGDEQERWETGALDVRRHLLATVRAADPERGRALLASTWGQDAAREREQLLAGLATGLGPGDEPFLEAALDDRAQSVRAAAAGLLAALPGSALAARMAARLRPLIECGRRELTVALPGPELDDASRRDGLTLRAPARTGRAAWILHQLVAAAPLDVWTEACDRPPAKVVAMKVRDRMGDALAAAWTEAAARQRDAAWARALLDRGKAAAQQLAPLLAIVPPEAAEAHVAARLPRQAAGAEPLLPHVPPPWSEAFTALVFKTGLAQPSPAAWLRAAGRHGAPSFAPRAAAALERLDPASAAARHARDAAGLLDFRRAMLSTLKGTP
ncbi:MAG TPA: DUF5691 domain-containing protein [Solirubrobacteraceae bacterium]